ncbi:MAG: DNA polymerase I, partial [Actinobacteria bacterium]|nr:DNA polymerase I [Actinomycetota bacterium]
MVPLTRSDTVGIALAPGVGVGFARGDDRWSVATADPVALIAEAATADSPRWVWWGRETSDLLAGLPIDRCWDVATVHRFLHGTWKAPISVIWSVLQGLDPDSLPTMGQLGLLDAPVDEGDRELPIRPDGHLRPEWIAGAFAETPDRLATWAGLALDAMGRQILLLDRLPDPDRAHATARSESAADLLCAEMTIAGLPIDVPEAERLISASAGRRPRTSAEEDEIRAERDERVLSKLESSHPVNLRNPGEVKAMLRRHGHDLPDTRAWRLEELRTTDPLIDALLTWRKDERIATTFGWHWLDEHVRDGRLRGEWASSDGAAGRMSASAGLHNLPSIMRPVVAAETGELRDELDAGAVAPHVEGLDLVDQRLAELLHV